MFASVLRDASLKGLKFCRIGRTAAYLTGGSAKLAAWVRITLSLPALAKIRVQSVLESAKTSLGSLACFRLPSRDA